ncbi:hypothetical protein FP435_00155 (plasmid) [Lactobacillus sp. PV037]|uniref:hypothetical protein n=1 Tax=Lactobacillus sp. PV037 TaxID=2594496 RepID=UPI002240D20D|nr:hypothetical protein [Lactobacillus sp. PV037]QNQ82950.1 hypothetical protein FP435_00155 [Lactobacillus sp. PV037]
MRLKRAEKVVEDKILKRSAELLPNISDFKVYFQVHNDGSYYLNSNGQIALQILTDEDILSKVNSGQMFEIPNY